MGGSEWAGENVSAWAWGWDALVALGTLLLAAGTGILALFTARLATRTSELAQESAADLRAQWRPFLLPAGDVDSYQHGSTPATQPRPPSAAWDPGVTYSDGNRETREFSVRIRNAGRGPALHVRAQLELAGVTGSFSPQSRALGALSTGDVQVLSFRIPQFEESAQLLLDYRDLADVPYATSCTITVDHNPPRFYDVRTWENHSVTTLGDAGYPQPGLRDVSPHGASADEPHVRVER